MKRETMVRINPSEGFILVDDGKVTPEMWAKKIDDALHAQARKFKKALMAEIERRKRARE